MVTYTPEATIARRLDPRTKLLFQVGFAAVAFAYTSPRGLAVLTVIAIASVVAAGGSVGRFLWAYRYAAPVLVLGPLVAGATLGTPWFQFDRAWETTQASYRVVLVLLVAGAYVRSTPVRESRAAIQRTIPGRAGQFLGVGVALVFRFLPLLRRDLSSAREAVAARLGAAVPLHRRIQLIATVGLNRALGRADRLGLALQARCFAWNPTLPPLSFERLDYPVLAVGCGFLTLAALSVLVGA